MNISIYITMLRELQESESRTPKRKSVKKVIDFSLFFFDINST